MGYINRSRRGALAAAAGLTLVAAVTVTVGGVAGASTEPSGSGAASGDPAAEAAAARARVEPYLSRQTEIPDFGPLDGPIEPRSVYFLPQNIQSSEPMIPGFESAAEAIGWNLTVAPFDPADPQAVVAGVTQAIEGGADYIAVVAQPAESLGEALDAAKEAGVPIIAMYTTDEDLGPESGIYANVGGPDSSRNSYPYMADLVIADSGGQANVLFVNVPDFPILQIADEATTGQFADACTECTVTKLDLSVSDLTSGNVPSAIASSLQSNPDIDYVFVSFGDLAIGLPSTLEGVGLADQVKIVGNVPTEEQIQSLIDDTSFAYIVLPQAYSSWAAVDAMLRLDQGMEIDQELHSVLPLEIWTNETVPEPAAIYEGPEGYQDQFLALWGLGG